jgi:hypothetical protein
MNEISGWRVIGFIVLTVAIVVGTLLFAAAVSAPNLPEETASPAATPAVTAPAASGADETRLVLPSGLKPLPSLPSPLPAN